MKSDDRSMEAFWAFNHQDDNTDIMQFTGLHAKVGEIYEGDILAIHHWQYNTDHIAVVEWNDGEWVLSDKDGRLIEFWDDGNHSWYNLSAFNPEEQALIIGNKFEDPELLQ